MAADTTPTFSSNRASYSQRQNVQEQLRATQEELSTKVRELQIYEANYMQLKKELTRWKKKFEYIFRENELLSLETAKLDASHKQIAFLQQEIKFKEEESEALRGLVSALEASNKKVRATRLNSSARLAAKKDLPAAAAAGAAMLDNSTTTTTTAAAVPASSPPAAPAAEIEQLATERKERAAEKERFLSEIATLKSENSMLLKDMDRRDTALQLSEDKINVHKLRISALEMSLKEEQDKQMKQLREKQDVIADLEAQIVQLEKRRRTSSAVSREEADAPVDFGPTHRLKHPDSIAENGEPRASGDNIDPDELEEPDTPPGTPPPISAGILLPPVDPTADQIIKDWEDDKRLRAAPSTEFEWNRLESFLQKLPYEAKEGAERILKQVLDPYSHPTVSESQVLIRAIPLECKKELVEFLVPLLKAHNHMRVTYSTQQRRTLVTDVRLTLEPRESEFTGGLAFGEKRFGRDHVFYGPSNDDISKLVMHTTRTLTTDKKAAYVSKPQDLQRRSSGSDLERTSGETDSTTFDGEAPPAGSENKPKGKWLTNRTKKLMVTMAMGAKQRVARLNQAKYSHEGTTCQFCKATPIVGCRYSCATCVGFDLCENCYSLGGHGLENSDELFYRTQELVLARCPRLVEELDLLELLRFEICRSNLRKFSFCLNWLADIVNGKTSQQLQARALEIPGIRRDIRKQFVPILLRICSDREDLEVKTEWELESDNSAEVKSVTNGVRGSLNEGDGRFLETLRIWVADQYRTTSPFVERSLLKFREGMAVEGDSDEPDSDDGDDERRDQVPEMDEAPLPPMRKRAATASARMTVTGKEVDQVASSRRGWTERNRILSQEF
ncbi:hypothetical protein Poli38472_006960 [Pythium oligandrum]|uniref:ZZ-type domain-containing protein n=1 Tax=Pythium oligandrum TaxID=41045 RepID=A0A8K1FCX3_PYTOL|nr:hypothetical protein Poli38472_006960 [Pythium oligandrum]|eukprot:TMW58815.1 hypothetical protein Poli38472_006960 [Pythium oligandrum]